MNLKVLSLKKGIFLREERHKLAQKQLPSALQLEIYQCCCATVCFSHVGPQMWRLKAVSHNPTWQWCHEQQVPWIHLQPRERGGKRPLKSLTHHKRGERGEDDEVWVIRQFFHSIKGGYAKEKQVWMSLLAMVTLNWPLAENNVTEMCDNNPCFVICQRYVWGDSSTEKMASPVPSWADLQAKPNTEWIMMCQQPPASGFRLKKSGLLIFRVPPWSC